MSGWFIITLLAGLTANGAPEPFTLRSRWDENLLNTQLSNVNIKSNAYSDPQIKVAWNRITTTYLLRVNICLDEAALGDSTQFVFKKEKATAKDLFEAFVLTYPAYTYTHDPATGVIWIHPRQIRYDTILSEKVEIRRAALQVPMYSGVLRPLFNLLHPSPSTSINIMEGKWMGSPAMWIAQWNISVDLPSGVYSVRHIINFCCMASPNRAFIFQTNHDGRTTLTPFNLLYDNPLAQERPGAIGFWECEIGVTPFVPPSEEVITSALCDASPRIRWAAREYIRSDPDLHHVITTGNQRTNAWQYLGWKSIRMLGRGDLTYMERIYAGQNSIVNDLMRVDPGLSLVLSMELAREKKDASLMDVISGHSFSELEIANIKPDVYRIARESKLVRDKLLQMHIGVPDMASEDLNELGNTNLFTRVTSEKK